MKKVNITEIKEEPWQSPGGNYAAHFKGISIALGRDPESLDLAKRHSFDLEWTRVPPGKHNFPYHAHSAAWELYLVVSGKGSVRDKDGKTDVVAGDAFIFGPDKPHQITNSGEEDLIYYVIADNPIGESAYYPDSGKWKVNKTSASDRVVIKSHETDYFDGEE
ncbi:MAG: cupin [Verrucomicrobia bacterium 13_1_20CM_4_55_9]|nr:MAG: cupin [Verrucomicrobia bacterium 13_1_20CM_4_55_9]HTD01616.1 cupin domain-containing protein [Chthoniobacterales bacterium]